jgi:hypothetical protein
MSSRVSSQVVERRGDGEDGGRGRSTRWWSWTWLTQLAWCHLHFITMDVSALFLPVHLDVDMVCVLSWQLFVLVQQALGHQIQVHTLYPFINSFFFIFLGIIDSSVLFRMYPQWYVRAAGMQTPHAAHSRTIEVSRWSSVQEGIVFLFAF